MGTQRDSSSHDASDRTLEVTSRSSFARRVLALLHTSPIHELEATKAMRGTGQYVAYDMVTLQLLTIDFVTDNMTLESGAPYQMVVNHTAREAEALVPSRPPDEYLEVALTAIRNLVNDGRGAIVREAADPAGHLQPMEIELMREEMASDGGIELRTTPQAINLYIDAFDLDIESSQDAYRTMLQAQLSRGRLGKASETAVIMRKLSKRYQEEVRLALEAACRDITRVDWSGSTLRQIAEAYNHVEESSRQLTEIRESVLGRVEQAEDHDSRLRLQEIASLLQDSCQMHWELYSQLLGARSMLLEQHERQVLAPSPSLARVAIDGELLSPVLQMRPRPAMRLLDRFAIGTIPPHGEVLDLYLLVSHIWRAPQARELTVRPVEAIELKDIDLEPPLFLPQVVEDAREVLGQPFHGRRLSDVLVDLEQRDPDGRLRELVAIGTLFAFAVDEGLTEEQKLMVESLVPSGLRAEKTNARFAKRPFCGDELVLNGEGRA